MFNIVLVEPEIPENTGNISRTCAVTGAALHLVRPLGFSTDDKHLKRAGLDYWKYLSVTYYDSFEEVEAAHPEARFFLASTHATRNYAQAEYRDGFSGVRQGNSRLGGSAAYTPRSRCRAHSHAQRQALSEPFKLSCNCAL